MSLAIIPYLVLTNEDWEDGLLLDDGGDPAEPLDLTGSSFRAQIRASEASLLVILEASTDNGLLAVDSDPETGFISWNVPRATMAAIEPGEYVYDIVWTKPDTSRDTIVAGTLTVKRGITR